MKGSQPVASELLTVKRRFDFPAFRTLGGATIKNVAIGYETYGKLNTKRDNAILVTHFFSGSSHAAGRYAPDDPEPGWWDAIIGPGKAADTDRYFVIASDTLVNLNVHDPQVITTGPASIDPATGRAYGLTFPAVGISDFVRVQKALVESLGIKRLRAVMGPSMGGLQAYEWAASFPESVERIVAAIAAPNFGGWLAAWLSMWAQPIKLDPAWNGGDYYGGAPPRAGLEAALRLMTLHAHHPRWAEEAGGRALRASAAADDVRENPFAIEAALAEAAAARAKKADANHLLYLARANQTYIPGAAAGARDAAEGLRRIRAPVLALYAPQDQVFLAEWVEAAVDLLRDNGVSVETDQILGPYGHYNGILRIADASARIADFLAREF